MRFDLEEWSGSPNRIELDKNTQVFENCRCDSANVISLEITSERKEYLHACDILKILEFALRFDVTRNPLNYDSRDLLKIIASI